MVVEYILRIKMASFKCEETQKNKEDKLIRDLVEMPWINGAEMFKFHGGEFRTFPKFRKDSRAKTFDEDEDILRGRDK